MLCTSSGVPGNLLVKERKSGEQLAAIGQASDVYTDKLYSKAMVQQQDTGRKDCFAFSNRARDNIFKVKEDVVHRKGW